MGARELEPAPAERIAVAQSIRAVPATAPRATAIQRTTASGVMLTPFASTSVR